MEMLLETRLCSVSTIFNAFQIIFKCGFIFLPLNILISILLIFSSSLNQSIKNSCTLHTKKFTFEKYISLKRAQKPMYRTVPFQPEMKEGLLGQNVLRQYFSSVFWRAPVLALIIHHMRFPMLYTTSMATTSNF